MSNKIKINLSLTIEELDMLVTELYACKEQLSNAIDGDFESDGDDSQESMQRMELLKKVCKKFDDTYAVNFYRHKIVSSDELSKSV